MDNLVETLVKFLVYAMQDILYHPNPYACGPATEQVQGHLLDVVFNKIGEWTNFA